MDYRFNPPPNWPIDDPDWTPPPGWVPDPSWGPAPEGWNFWVPRTEPAPGAPDTAEYTGPGPDDADPRLGTEPGPDAAPDPESPYEHGEQDAAAGAASQPPGSLPPVAPYGQQYEESSPPQYGNGYVYGQDQGSPPDDHAASDGTAQESTERDSELPSATGASPTTEQQSAKSPLARFWWLGCLALLLIGVLLVALIGGALAQGGGPDGAAGAASVTVAGAAAPDEHTGDVFA